MFHQMQCSSVGRVHIWLEVCSPGDSAVEWRPPGTGVASGARRGL